MIIYSKQQNIILDTEKFDLIGINLQMEDEDDYNYPDDDYTIYAYGSENFRYIELAEYDNPEKAQKVLRDIFIAMTDNLKTFKMPD